MRLKAPCSSIPFQAEDIFGEKIDLTGYQGRPLMLSFFRNAGCPFCNYRIYELAHNYRDWQAAGMEVIVFFSSNTNEVRKHVARHPRPYRIVADPDLSIYNQYRVEKSSIGALKALIFKLPRVLKGFQTGGEITPNPHPNLVPADFLINPEGNIVDLWYGQDIADHIPLTRVKEFIESTGKNEK